MSNRRSDRFDDMEEIESDLPKRASRNAGRYGYSDSRRGSGRASGSRNSKSSGSRGSGRNNNKRYDEEEKKTPVAAVAVILVLVLALLVGLGYFAVKYIVPKDAETESTSGGGKTGKDAVNTKTITDKKYFEVKGEITAEFIGDKLYAGGQTIAEDYRVTLTDADGTHNIDYRDFYSDQFEDDFRLAAGKNTIEIKYGDKSATVEVNAVPLESEHYSPSYLLHRPDSATIEDLIMQIEKQELTYKDALSGWGYIGDSQVAALNLLYNLADDSAVMAEVGSGLDYIFDNYNTALSMLSNKNSVIIHTGINSLVAFPENVDIYIQRYGELIDRLKADRPDLRIVISGLFPVSQSIVNTMVGYSMIDETNFKLCKLCMEKGVEFVSNYGDIVGKEEYFGPDGLHMNMNFYTEYWMKDLMRKVGG